jgi:hypothetical protein
VKQFLYRREESHTKCRLVHKVMMMATHMGQITMMRQGLPGSAAWAQLFDSVLDLVAPLCFWVPHCASALAPQGSPHPASILSLRARFCLSRRSYSRDRVKIGQI